MSPEVNRKLQLEQELRRLTEIIIREYKPQRMILFGSLAQGKVHEWSDIDLVIVKDTPKQFLERMQEIFLLTHPTVTLNVVVYTPSEVIEMEKQKHYFWKDEIVAKGKVLYDRAA